jgi:hypothetical protein
MAAFPDERAPGNPGKTGSWLVALACLALGLFFLALAIGILAAPVDGPWFAGVLLKLFIGLMFGGIVAGCAVGLTREGRRLLARRDPSDEAAGLDPEQVLMARPPEPGEPAGQTERPTHHGGRPLPAVLVDLCPHCGRAGLATSAVQACVGCGQPRHPTATWEGEQRSLVGGLAGLMVGGALTALGLFVALGPFFDGERRPWALVAFAALGLLIGLVGGVLLWGGLANLFGDLFGPRAYRFHASEPTPLGHSMTVACAHLLRGRVVKADGITRTSSPATEGLAASPGLASPAQRGLAEQLSLLHRHQLLSVWRMSTVTWRRGRHEGPPGAPLAVEPDDRTTVRELLMTRVPARVGAYLPDAVAGATLRLHPFLDDEEPVSAPELWRVVRAQPELMASLVPPGATPFRAAETTDSDPVAQAVAAELAASERRARA